MGSTLFLGFSCPNTNLLLVFLNLLFLGTSYIFFSRVLRLSLGLNIFSVPYFELRCRKLEAEAASRPKSWIGSVLNGKRLSKTALDSARGWRSCPL